VDTIETEVAEEDATKSSEPSPTTEPVEEESDGTDTDKSTSGSVTIKSTNFFNDEEEVLRVRDEATASGNELGFAVVGEEYDYLGEKENGWYMIDFEGEEGWVSGKYVEVDLE